MIPSFKHRGLEDFRTRGRYACIQPIHADRLRELLTALNIVKEPQYIGRHSWRVHGLTVGLGPNNSVIE